MTRLVLLCSKCGRRMGSTGMPDAVALREITPVAYRGLLAFLPQDIGVPAGYEGQMAASLSQVVALSCVVCDGYIPTGVQ